MDASRSLPSLPGMDLNKESWLKRHHNRGFAKSRPQSAGPGVSLNANLKEFDFASGTFHSTPNTIRPSTASERTRSYDEKQLKFHRHSSSDIKPRDLRSSRETFVEDTDEPMVCRFAGFFTEDRQFDIGSPLGLPSLSDRVIRYVTINYYVRNSTVEINERKVKNSGIAGGKFFKRNKLIKPNGSQLVLFDLLPGNSLHILGQEFSITEADQRSKEYFRRMYNLEIEDMAWSEGLFTTSVHDGAQFSTGMGCSHLDLASSFPESPDNYTFDEDAILIFQCADVPQYVSKDITGRTVTLPKLPPLDQRIKKLQLTFDIAAKTLEIRGLKSDFGRNDAPPRLLKKVKVARNWREVQRGSAPVYYHAKDFVCGQMVEVYGRLLLLLKCDDDTQMYYENRGIYQEEVILADVEDQKLMHTIPGHGDGFLAIGNPADTLSTVYGSIRPNESFKNLIRNKGKMLKCKAELIPSSVLSKSINRDSKYEITYFLEDDSIRIYDMGDRRRGQKGAVFLVRGKYLNGLPSNSSVPRHFTPSDIYLGNVVSINGIEMRIVNLESSSSLFCEQYPKEFPFFDAYRIINVMMNKILTDRLDLRSIFRDKDPRRKEMLNRDDMISVLDAVGIGAELNDQELVTMLKRYHVGEGDAATPSNLQMYSYDDLCDMCVFVHGLAGQLPDDGLTGRLRAAHKRWRRSIARHAGIRDFISLDRLMQAFAKHNFALTAAEKALLVEKFAVSRQEAMTHRAHFAADPPKVLPASRSKKPESKDNLFTEDVDLVQIRRNQVLLSTLNRSSKASQIGTASTTASTNVTDDSRVIINYTSLCDAIYACDWM